MEWLTTLLAMPELQTALISLFGILLTIFFKRAAGALQAATGIAIDEKHLRALHSAIQSGVEAALAEGPEAGLDMIKAHAIYHAQQSVPDAIEALVPGDGVLDRIAVRYYREAMARVGVAVPA
ncbi:hypothetical protein [Ponticoccus litoralis]|uniref:Uncharacterized protein n=1 Tax=Ponticoccus litoralis TaxID=422297 RepID=A0AAW9SNE2_9RHOB